MASLSHVMNCEEFSSLDHQLSTTTLMLKFCHMHLNRIQPKEIADSCNLNVKAEYLRILECQQVVAADKNFKHWQKPLDLFQDEGGVWGCRGRIQNATVPYSIKHPNLGEVKFFVG